MNRIRTPSFSIDPSRRRDGLRERWSPLTDDGGDLRSRHREDPETRGRDARDEAATPEAGSS